LVSIEQQRINAIFIAAGLFKRFGIAHAKGFDDFDRG